MGHSGSGWPDPGQWHSLGYLLSFPYLLIAPLRPHPLFSHAFQGPAAGPATLSSHVH